MTKETDKEIENPYQTDSCEQFTVGTLNSLQRLITVFERLCNFIVRSQFYCFGLYRKVDCKLRALDGNSKFCILLDLSWFKAGNKRKGLVKKISRFCRTVLEISKQKLLPWQLV